MIFNKPKMKDCYNRNVKLSKNSIIFNREIEEIKRERYGKGLDKKPIGMALIQKKIIKHPYWNNIKTDLKKWTFLPEDKLGQINNPIFSLFVFMIIAFITVVLIAGMMYSMNLINNALINVGSINEANAGNPGYTNMTYAAQVTFGAVNNATKGMPLVSISIIFSLMMGIIMSSFFLRVHPAFFFLYVLLTVLAIIFSVPISNAYQTLLQSNIFDGYLTQQPMGNWILINLPMVVCVVGILGGIMLLINIVRNEQEGPL